ncbi:putative toxin-antitoxin system, toxin component [Paenibacillus larvae subsp. larvae]|uniref:Putative toxin-antitoxin system, toxin component n=1 Tax=Paenibacillus larvae subsp. larvae TaxID=147375 RepID=A0A2L1UIP9_9BACL|nr:SRPBCC domain-containing protein [Paenibacillus larvae]AQT84584.1 polyketide cyclase [Paenibacillus larvae subsp. pulvifaciens]AQZ46584.1 polyketide cyclase [Paenibacillus larvae subsp. pulvifaciens]AVF28303.1 putative toxin-antitoxin system, toxin component [Paenibacillus larvae subsp. larvae]AVF32806.1 putative toxin-antitoxin system, toxin component [Paenibacillus larvae subsp. larvae]MBH0343805.1 polyketide cyclase [Paenibacillus larvae]
MENNSNNTLPDIRKTLVLNASIQKVWDAVATAEGIAAWFMPNDFQPVEGHEFHLNAGPYGMSPCKVTVIDPPNKLSFNWGNDWTLTFELVDLDGKTEFTLTHGGWDADKVTEFGQSHTIICGNMAEGWEGLKHKLAAYVEA